MTDRTVLHTMLKRERHSAIIRQLNLHNRVLSADLSQLLNVSEDTVRRDLIELADLGQLVKVHGGALSNSYGHHAPQADLYAPAEKDVISQKALSLLEDGMFVLFGGGTTIRSLIAVIPENLKLTCFTPSPVIALDLLEHPNLEVQLIGGRLSPETQISTGGEVVSRLGEIKADLYLMGTMGIDLLNGLSESDMEVVQVKRAMMRAANKVAVLTISEKLGTSYRMKLCEASDLDYLVSELPPDHPQLQGFARAGIGLL